METTDLLWVDLRKQRTDASFFSDLCNFCQSRKCQVHTLRNTHDIAWAIPHVRPKMLFFEYDYPDLYGLNALQQTKLHHPSLPIVMLTEQHSEALAVWALRGRVWDYLVKPLAAEEICHRVTHLSKLLKDEVNHTPRKMLMPQHTIPIEARFRATRENHKCLFPVMNYIETHYHEKIPFNELAELCGMRASQFSRLFKREHGMTFREFLIRYRIDKAKHFLQHPSASIVDVAFAVGFNDHSHFSRMFRRYVGMSPSTFRERSKQH